MNPQSSNQLTKIKLSNSLNS